MARFGPNGSLRLHIYRKLVGPLASTGLRIGEAVRLTMDDVLLDAAPPMLRILNTKFPKSRLVPLHPTTASALREYALERERLKYGGMTDAFLVSETGTSLKSSTAGRTFQRLLDRLEIRATDGSRRPTLHSFTLSCCI
ncbi:MAG: tyrosine-type recombinase/integrase [Blastocatellia bacterium]|nr:tyrosine-type recombinase/integrase [Blastocatellia bacterium]MBK6428986.1 tyrosine-type recombinase/integrase [Blastocatellia bacterium]